MSLGPELTTIPNSKLNIITMTPDQISYFASNIFSGSSYEFNQGVIRGQSLVNNTQNGESIYLNQIETELVGSSKAELYKGAISALAASGRSDIAVFDWLSRLVFLDNQISSIGADKAMNLQDEFHGLANPGSVLALVGSLQGRQLASCVKAIKANESGLKGMSSTKSAQISAAVGTNAIKSGTETIFEWADRVGRQINVTYDDSEFETMKRLIHIK